MESNAPGSKKGLKPKQAGQELSMSLMKPLHPKIEKNH